MTQEVKVILSLEVDCNLTKRDISNAIKLVFPIGINNEIDLIEIDSIEEEAEIYNTN